MSTPTPTPSVEVATPEPRVTRRGKRRAKRRRTHTVAKVLVSTLVVLGLVTGLSVTYLYRHLNGNLTVMDIDDQLVGDRPDKVEVTGPQEPLNVLVMGSDTREGANNIDGLTGGGERSDTTLLLHFSADRERAYGVSIPRDSMVDRPECRTEDGTTTPAASYQMWNVAYQLAGPACTIQQFEALTGIRLDHFVVVDFTGFQDMVDAVGGVEQHPPVGRSGHAAFEQFPEGAGVVDRVAHRVPPVDLGQDGTRVTARPRCGRWLPGVGRLGDDASIGVLDPQLRVDASRARRPPVSRPPLPDSCRCAGCRCCRSCCTRRIGGRPGHRPARRSGWPT